MNKDETLFCRSNHKKERFLQVSLLLLLYDKPGYGYGLLDELALFGFAEDQLNISTLYRTFRKMEKDGLAASCWEEGGPGPRRRVYKITEKGKQDLELWINILKARKAQIDKLTERYDEITLSSPRGD